MVKLPLTTMDLICLLLKWRRPPQAHVRTLALAELREAGELIRRWQGCGKGG